MRFEWDEKKAASNLRKHKVSFDETVTVFYDRLSATGGDPDHSLDERRWVTFGVSSSNRLLVVAHSDREETIGIISARPATPAERSIYEEAG